MVAGLHRALHYLDRAIGAVLQQRRRLFVAARRGKAAARRKGAAPDRGLSGRGFAQRRDDARDLAQAPSTCTLAPARDRCEQAARIGVHRSLEQRVDGGLFDLAPGVHDHHTVRCFRDDAQVMGDQHDGGADTPVEFHHQLEDLGLDGDVECRGRFVGDQQFRVARQRHRNHHALAHAAGELVRVVVHAALGVRDAHQAQHLDRTRQCRGLGQPLVDRHRFGDLRAHGMHWIERRHGFLEHHRDLVAADSAHLRLVQRGQVLALEVHRTLHDAPRTLRDQAHHRQGGDRFAAAALADDTQHLAGLHGERQALDRAHHAVAREEARVQVVDGKDGLTHDCPLPTCCARCAGRADHAIRRPAG